MVAIDARPQSPALVIAPAGAGKTTLLAQYASTFSGWVGWLRIESLQASSDRLVDRVHAALPVRGEHDRSLLIIDDLHLIEDVEAEGILLDRCLMLADEENRILIASRRMPHLTLSRHEFSDMTVIDGEQLRFRAWEVERLLREVYREPLPADDVAALSRRVGGWAAGLKLYHLSTRGRPLTDRRRAVASLGGRSALSRDYLSRNVLAELDASLRRFLVRTCVFDVLSGRRCDQLLGTTDGQRRLEELQARQAFTVTHDGGQTFMYHEVLRAHLLATLVEQLGASGARAWHVRAGQILAEEGTALEAARCYARAEDWLNVHRLLDAAGSSVADRGLDPWCDLLPAWFIAEDPWLVLAEGRHRASHGQFEAAVTALQRAETMFTSEPARLRCRAFRSTVAAWVPDGAPWRGHWSGWLREATRRHPMVVAGEAETLPEPEGALVKAIALLLAGHFTEAERIANRMSCDDQSLLGLSTRLLRIGYGLAAGDQAAKLALAAVGTDAERQHLPWLARIARAMTALDGTPAGAKEAASVAEECEHLGDRWGAFLAGAIAALSASLHGGPELHEANLLLSRAQTLNSGVLTAWAQALLALASVRAAIPDADTEVRRAESLARSAGVPGARVLALTAAMPTNAGRAAQLAAVRAVADQAGLPRRLVRAWAVNPGLVSVGGGTEAQDPICLRCFGGFRFLVDGRELNWSGIRPRARALVRMLAMHAGRAVHRDRLLDAFWPDTDPATATRSLHVALSTLRRFFEVNLPGGSQDQLLCRDGDAYLLAISGNGCCDVATFRDSLERVRRSGAGLDTNHVDHLRVAVSCYTGELLPEDGSAEWVVSEREKLRLRAADAAAELATAELAAAERATAELAETAVSGSRVESAIRAASRCVEIDQCHDLGWRLLIEAHSRAGNMAAAERARRGYAGVLASLGLDPATTAEPVGQPVSSDRRIPLPRSPQSVELPARTSSRPPA